MPLVRLLRSAAFARAVLLYLAALCGVAAWLPWVRGAEGATAPAWAAAGGLERPFASAWFLAGVAALFASTLACTWGRRARTAALWRGEPPPGAVRLEAGPGRDPAAFLRARGFAGPGPALFRHRAALWGGWVLHVGLLALIAGVAVQQAFHDGGSFELAVGERRRLADPGAVFQREAGPLAPDAPPDLEVALLEFDPYRHQPGYAPDRRSLLELRRPGEAPVRAALDRAAGVRHGGVEVFQAIPAGLAAVVERPDGGRLALHLQTRGRAAVAEARDAGGGLTRLVVEAERGLDDRAGTGALAARLESSHRSLPLEPGAAFSFGGDPLRLAGWARWSGFTYSRSPGMPAVLAGFALVLAGAGLLALPAGLARLPGPGESAALVFLPRGAEALRLEWERDGAPPSP
ncbi:MAG TPA: hypothetical protein VH880_12325 [Anaeromyxobacteraceae bacterium]